MLVVGSKVKAFIKEKGCHTSGELLDGLSEKVQALLEGACERCKGNKRSTVKKIDL